uniref:putative reverse transcriptase/maturase n=1 Tax=Chroothece richteriana TaxID=101928 RepID=UPI001FCD2913|nr:putative reverse transcriptase/maturase [Chroothece richteriana]UNJ14278.1 putative reverse transcriptase/maturase [Chroothece richteriana]
MNLNIASLEDSQWINFNWKAIENRVKFLRYRIFNASKKKDVHTTVQLQQLMLNSSANVLLAIRRVTAQNRNLSGLNKIRVHLIEDLISTDLNTYKPLVYANLLIPTSYRKQKLLKIQIIKDHCIQFIVRNALEPQWEAKFEDNNYGSRPGRSSHDAINHMVQILKKYSSKSWVVNIHLGKALANIKIESILNKIHDFPKSDIIFAWLKADYFTDQTYYHSENGIPQGDIITSLLANIALDELDKGIKKIYYSLNSHHFYIRYNDSILIFCASKDIALEMRGFAVLWLKNVNLLSNVEHLEIINTKAGFTFLGVDILPRKEEGLISIVPSQEAIKIIRIKLKTIWMRGRGKDVQWVIDKLNPRIREWCNYYCFYKSSQIFKDIDNWMFQRSVRYCKRTHANKSWGWMKQKYFGRFNIKKNSKWIFGDKESGKYLIRFSWTAARQYIPIQIQASPDNSIYAVYWFKRNASGIMNNQLWNKADFKIAQRQNHICPVCESTLYNQEPIEKHRIIIKKSAAKISSFNMIFVHSICYECIKKIFSY